jgi:hypothetical protein
LLDKKSIETRSSTKSSTKGSLKKRKSTTKKHDDDLEGHHRHTEDEDCDDEYAHFVKDNKIMWKGMTLLAALGFIGLAAGTFVINKNEEQECLGITSSLYLIMANHVVNATVAFLFFTGMERRLCSAFGLTVYSVM